MSRSIHVRAPCRLHFGMFSFGHADQPQFGGVGVIVDSPAIEVEIRPADVFAVCGELAERTWQFAASALRKWNVRSQPRCEIIVHSPPDHAGLGVGTQLGLSVAAGLRRFLNLPELPVEELANSVGRGARSAIGTHGFQHGGLLVDAGKAPGESLGKLHCRVETPDEWRFVLIRAEAARGLAGDREADAFARIPPVPIEVTNELWRIVESDMLPAIERLDCSAFSEAVYHFGRLAGECFAPVQGGPFATRGTAQLIEAIREQGVNGVGQSSWGPTVFAITRDQAQAEGLVQWLNETRRVYGDIRISAPNNRGAQISLS
jgi:beta-RFAP synthase